MICSRSKYSHAQQLSVSYKYNESDELSKVYPQVGMHLFSASGHEPFCRLYTPSTNLVLDGCSADVLIADVHASVTLSQRFTNPTKFALNATYAFGLMAGAAVCGFEMVRKDGTKVEGIVKASDEATSEYRQAIQEGKTASLGQEESHDGR